MPGLCIRGNVKHLVSSEIISINDFDIIYLLLLLLYKFVMRTMVDRKVESEGQIKTLDGTKHIGLAQ